MNNFGDTRHLNTYHRLVTGLYRRVHTNAVLETRFNVDSPNAYSIRNGLFTLQVTITKIYIVKTNGGHGVQCVASLYCFVSAFCCLFVAVKALISSEEVMATRKGYQ